MFLMMPPFLFQEKKMLIDMERRNAYKTNIWMATQVALIMNYIKNSHIARCETND